MRNVIVCGADGSGKTTLVKVLAEQLNFDVFSAGGPPRDNDHAIECCILQLEKMKSSDPYIFDRVTPISRQCYQLEISDCHRFVLNALLKEMLRYSVVVWCDTPELIHVVEDYDTKDHLKHIEDNHDAIVDNYKNIMANMCNVIRYDYTMHTIDWLMERINEAIY